MSFSLWAASSLQNHCGPPPWDLFSFLFHLLTCQCLPLDIRKLHWSQQRRLVLILDLCGYNFEKCCSTSRIKRVVYFGELARCFGEQSGPVIKSVALWTAWFPLCVLHGMMISDVVRLFHHLHVCFCHAAVWLWFAASGNRTFLEKLL